LVILFGAMPRVAHTTASGKLAAKKKTAAAKKKKVSFAKGTSKSDKKKPVTKKTKKTSSATTKKPAAKKTAAKKPATKKKTPAAAKGKGKLVNKAAGFYKDQAGNIVYSHYLNPKYTPNNVKRPGDRWHTPQKVMKLSDKKKGSFNTHVKGRYNLKAVTGKKSAAPKGGWPFQKGGNGGRPFHNLRNIPKGVKGGQKFSPALSHYGALTRTGQILTAQQWNRLLVMKGITTLGATAAGIKLLNAFVDFGIHEALGMADAVIRKSKGKGSGRKRFGTKAHVKHALSVPQYAKILKPKWGVPDIVLDKVRANTERSKSRAQLFNVKKALETGRAKHKPSYDLCLPITKKILKAAKAVAKAHGVLSKIKASGPHGNVLWRTIINTPGFKTDLDNMIGISLSDFRVVVNGEACSPVPGWVRYPGFWAHSKPEDCLFALMCYYWAGKNQEWAKSPQAEKIYRSANSLYTKTARSSGGGAPAAKDVRALIKVHYFASYWQEDYEERRAPGVSASQFLERHYTTLKPRDLELRSVAQDLEEARKHAFAVLNHYFKSVVSKTPKFPSRKSAAVVAKKKKSKVVKKTSVAAAKPKKKTTVKKTTAKKPISAVTKKKLSALKTKAKMPPRDKKTGKFLPVKTTSGKKVTYKPMSEKTKKGLASYAKNFKNAGFNKTNFKATNQVASYAGASARRKARAARRAAGEQEESLTLGDLFGTANDNDEDTSEEGSEEERPQPEVPFDPSQPIHIHGEKQDEGGILGYLNPFNWGGG
jgi:hypothetical protein